MIFVEHGKSIGIVLCLLMAFNIFILQDYLFCQTESGDDDISASDTASEEEDLELEDSETTESEEGVNRELIYYDSEGRDDPFVSLLIPSVPTGGTQKLPGVKGMNISELALFGLGKWGDEPVAFVTGSDGKAYTLHIGDIVFDGRVKAITDEKIIYEKWVFDVWNRPKPPKTVEVKLHTAEEVLQ